MGEPLGDAHRAACNDTGHPDRATGPYFPHDPELDIEAFLVGLAAAGDSIDEEAHSF